MDFCLRCNAWHDGLGCPINAEIARLRAELDAAHASINQHLGQTFAHRKEADALLKEIDAAHAALGIGPRDAVTIADAVEALKRERDAAKAERDASRLVSEGLHASNVKLRAALDKEREALSDVVRVVAEMPRAEAAESVVRWTERLSAVTISAARRAAEAKASACPLVGCGCDKPKQHETGSAAEAKEPPR